MNKTETIQFLLSNPSGEECYAALMRLYPEQKDRAKVPFFRQWFDYYPYEIDNLRPGDLRSQMTASGTIFQGNLDIPHGTWYEETIEDHRNLWATQERVGRLIEDAKTALFTRAFPLPPTWAAAEKSLKEAAPFLGVRGLEAARKAYALDRAQARIDDVVDVCRSYALAFLPGCDDQSVATLAWAFARVLEMDEANHRPGFGRWFGKGRQEATDGGAWGAAIKAAERLLRSSADQGSDVELLFTCRDELRAAGFGDALQRIAAQEVERLVRVAQVGSQHSPVWDFGNLPKLQTWASLLDPQEEE